MGRDELAEPEAERDAPRLLPPGRKGGVGAGRDGVIDARLLYAMLHSQAELGEMKTGGPGCD